MMLMNNSPFFCLLSVSVLHRLIIIILITITFIIVSIMIIINYHHCYPLHYHHHQFIISFILSSSPFSPHSPTPLFLSVN